MSLESFKNSLEDEVSQIVSRDMTITITETEYVPHIDDPLITNPNFQNYEQKCKLLETCVLFIDLRGSTDISNSHRRSTLAKLYTTFVRSMAKCAEYYNGHVRGIIGDRLMIVFDRENCFKNAIDTAILMNSAVKYIINKEFIYNNIQAGIGIDFGKMLIAKAGIVRHGQHNPYYKSLVWLGRPANIASKLTDIANKTISTTEDIVKEGLYFPFTDVWHWSDVKPTVFLNELIVEYKGKLSHKDDYFQSFFLSKKTHSKTYPRILFTESVFKGLKSENPTESALKKGLWKKQHISSIECLNGDLYGGDVHFSCFSE